MKKIYLVILTMFLINNCFSQLVDASLRISGNTANVYLIPRGNFTNVLLSQLSLTIVGLPNGQGVITQNTFSLGAFSAYSSPTQSSFVNAAVNTSVNWSSGQEILALTITLPGSGAFSLSGNEDEFYVQMGSSGATGSVSTIVLPITLKSFTASKLEGNNALLNWSTSSEVDASHFELERSFDLQTWTSIDKQAARGQQGIETSYSFVDQNIIAQRSNDGVCYYRLGMVDLDGSKKQSDIRSINLDPLTETFYQAFPNPAKGVINVQLQVPNTQANMTDLFLMDNAGRLHTKTAVSTNGITKIDVSDLPKGVYHVQVNTGTEMLSKKVILVED